MISAKFTPQCANPAAKNAVAEMFNTSAELLGTDYMDFYWIHNPVGAPKWIKELIPLAKSGKIGKIGLSNHNLAEIKENGIIFFSYMVLEQGALSGRYDTQHPFPADSDRGKTYNSMLPQLEKLNASLKEIADRHSVAIAQLPVAWAIAKGTLPIISVTKVHHVEDAAKAAALELTDDEIKTMEELASQMDLNVVRYWEKEMK